MRVRGQQVLRVVALALVVYLLTAWFRVEGRSPLGIALSALLLALLVIPLGILLWRRRRGRREARWELAIYRPELRPRAVRELRRRLAALLPLSRATRGEHARLSVLLAELLDAQGAYAEAMEVIDQVELAPLSVLDAGLVIHTRAVVHLRAGDAQGARRVLDTRETTGDPELDQRLLLLEAYARIELGDVAFGLAEAQRLALSEEVHESVAAEARVVWAAGLDAAGKREEALVVLTVLGREHLGPLSALGQPRARTLAQAALDGIS